MFFKFYYPPDGVKNWNDLFYGQAKNAVNFYANPKFTGYGEFTITIPYDPYFLSRLQINHIIQAGFDSNIDPLWLIIQTISFDTKVIIISGYDLNYLLTLRVSLFSETSQVQGYDPVAGNTVYCIQHYVDRNIISPADGERSIPMEFYANGVTGLSEDSYLAKLEPLNQIVDELCNTAGIGYRIAGAFGSGAAKFRMTMLSPTDKSINQSVNSPVVLGASRRNVKAVEFTHDVSNYLNAVYATGAGVTVSVYRSSVIPAGVERRECAVDVSTDTVADIPKYALYAVKDNLRTDSYNIEPSGSQYGAEFQVGDIVTVSDDALHNFYSALITEAEINIDDDGTAIRAVIGQQKPKLLNKIVNNLINGTYKKC